MGIRKLLYLLTLMAAAGCAPTPAPALPTVTATGRVPASQTPSAITAAATNTPAPSILPDAAALNGVHVEFWHVWDGALGEWIDDRVERFNQDSPYGLVVAASRKDDIYRDVLQALANGTNPDLAAGFNYHNRAWGGGVDLAPYIADPVWGFTSGQLDDFYSLFLSQAALDGRQAGLPFYRTAEVLLYNRTWARELGFAEPPSTPDALREQVCAANAAFRADAEPENDHLGGLMLGYGPEALVAWMLAFGGGLGSNVEGREYAVDKELNRSAFSFLRGLLDDGCAWVPEDVYPHPDFAGRLGLMLPTTLAGLPFQAAAMAEAGNSDAWAAIPYPAAAAGTSTLVMGPDLVLLPGSPEEQLGAWVFMTWLLEAENLASWTQAGGYYPVLRSLAPPDGPFLPDPQGWIPEGYPFSPPASWPLVRWAVSDAARVLYAPLNTQEEVPAILAELETLVDELSAAAP